MCGIAGCYQQADGQKLVDIMTDRIAHRGPDSAGTWNHEDGQVSVQLGHRRLSIIDLSAAADQPLTKHGLTMVYNGELYNYRALRAELISRGVRFTTNSDTEVVLEAWRCWGPGALTRFRGMFTFALADEQTGDLVLARDPLGIKPLYYLPRGAGVIFASELKALVAAVGSELRMEPGALVASMLYYWVPEQRCAISGVRKLPGGSWARFRPDGSCRWSTTGARPTWPRRPRTGRRPTSARSSRSPSPLTSCPTCRCRASCPADWTPASSPSSPTGPTPRSTPTRSPSVPRTSGSRPCRTMPSTRGRWPPVTASTCTRSRSRPTS
jgi:asparagine synthetase B (glutamine-hydrolysing)